MPKVLVENYKRVFFPMLWPFLEMLEHWEHEMSYRELIRFVDRLIVRINDNPEQYLRGELPEKEIIAQAVTEIFEEFLKKHEPVG